MKNNYSRISLIIVFVLVIAIGLICGMLSLKTPEVRTYSMNWTNQQTSFDEALENSDVVVIGKIKNTEVYKDKMVVFTKVDIEPIDILKGDIRNSYNVLFTGGKFNDVIYETERGKIPQDNDVYLFLLRARDNEGEYIPIGGYQGLFSLDVGSKQSKTITTDIKIKKFNQNNKLEKDLIGKSVKEIVK